MSADEILEKQPSRIDTPEQARTAGMKLHDVDGALYVTSAVAMTIISYNNNGRKCNHPYLSKCEASDKLHPLHLPRMNWYPFLECCRIVSHNRGRPAGVPNDPVLNQHISEAQKARHARPDVKDRVREGGKKSWETRRALQESGGAQMSKRALSMQRLRARRKATSAAGSGD
jgi:hypothetical protein